MNYGSPAAHPGLCEAPTLEFFDERAFSLADLDLSEVVVEHVVQFTRGLTATRNRRRN